MLNWCVWQKKEIIVSIVDVTGSFVATRGPYGQSELEADPCFPVADRRRVIDEGSDTALFPDGSRREGQVLRDAGTRWLYFKPVVK